MSYDFSIFITFSYASELYIKVMTLFEQWENYCYFDVFHYFKISSTIVKFIDHENVLHFQVNDE